LGSFQGYPVIDYCWKYFMKTNQLYDVVCIGNYTKDTIISPAGTKYVDGGGMNYAAHAAARMGLKVAVVTRLAKEDDRVVMKFNQAGIDCFPTYTAQSTLMCLEYPTLNPDIRNLSVNATAGAITVDQVMNLEMKSAVIGSSLRGEVGLDVIKVLKKKKVFLAADMQGFVRILQGQNLIYAPWDEMETTLPLLDVLKSDAVEAEYLTGEKDIYHAAKVFAGMGPKEIVLTHKDGLLILAQGKFHNLGFFPENMSGRSGRGDTCVGTYVAMRLSKSLLQAGIWAAAVTSLKMEKLGPFDRSISDVEALIHARYNHGSIN
jgi:sugar/nucleoside kinase (ribokinase family)